MAIAKAKNKKAAGLGNIPNEVIKNEKLIPVLHKLFNCYFSNNTVPNLWQKAIINPIPKGSGKDPYVPLNYRGISLLSSIGKIYQSSYYSAMECAAGLKLYYVTPDLKVGK